ncbi:MAG: 50S ribosomal protein L29 [Deltaproteobacteria bacterium]|nr:50S ribosomal protein L29 [Deltaproteobacteria bacterium]
MAKEKKSLHSQSLDELKAKFAQLKEEIFRLQMQKATGQLANPASIKQSRQELARTLTVLSVKQRKAG